MNYYRFFRPLLFSLDPECAHNFMLSALGHAPYLLMQQQYRKQHVQVMGLDFVNRVGLAAGLDKNGEACTAFARLGFGHIEIGTVTPKPQPGNVKPRLFRLPEHHAVINRMGFNNDGVEAVCRRVAAQKPHLQSIIGINIGKNKTTPNEEALSDYLYGFHHAAQVADYIALNVSSPNTRGLRELQHGNALRHLLEGLKAAQGQIRQQHGRYIPLAVKIAPDNSTEELHQIIDAVGESQIDALITTNTTIDKGAVAGHRYGSQAGGLSGLPLREKSTAVTGQVRAALPDIALIAVGGVMSADDMRQKLDAGADLVQLYTGFVYHGPPLVDACIRLTE